MALKGHPNNRTDQWLGEIRDYAGAGHDAGQIAVIIGVSAQEVMSCATRHGFTVAATRHRPAETTRATRAELIAAAQPRRQHPWSAKDVP